MEIISENQIRSRANQTSINQRSTTMSSRGVRSRGGNNNRNQSSMNHQSKTMSSRAVRSRERHIDFVRDYLVPWYMASYRSLDSNPPSDGQMKFQTEKGNLVVFHFELDKMKMYLERTCYWFCSSENMEISSDELEIMAQNLLNELTSKLYKQNPGVGREVLFWIYSRRCVIKKPVDINDLLNFVFSMGFKDLRDMILNNGLHLLQPEVSLPVVCTFHSALLGYRQPEKFRLGLHIYEQEYYHIDESDCRTNINPSSLLKHSDTGTYYNEEDEQTSGYVSDDYAKSRGRVYTVRGPLSMISFESFVRYITDITHYSHQPFELKAPVYPTSNAKPDVDYESESESEFDEDLREVVQGQLNLNYHFINQFRLQILSNDHVAIQKAVSVANSPEDKVAYSFTLDEPEIFFDMSYRQPFFTIYPSSIDGLVRFMRAYVDVGSAWRFGLEIMRPSQETLERMMGAVRIVGLYSLYRIFYIVQSSKESMLEVVQKLAGGSEDPGQTVTGSFTVLEVPDFKYLQRSKSVSK